MRRRAFTLIELLIVIAILSLLAALLFPVFGQARDKAREATCASDFKQQALAISLYLQDTDEKMPLLYTSDTAFTYNSPPATIMWQALQRYLRNTQVYSCPSDPITDDKRLIVDLPPPTTLLQRQFNLGIKTNFGFNYQYLSPMERIKTGGYVSRPTQLSAIGSPAATVLAADGVWLRNAEGTPYGGGSAGVDMPCRTDDVPIPIDVEFWLGGWNPSQPLSSSLYGRVWPWHGERATVAFCDGHVKALTMRELSAGCDVRDGWGGSVTDISKYLWDLQ